jgi:hypothetical protein
MEGLEKRISGDWFDIKNSAEDLRELEEYFELTAPDFETAVREIRLSVEEGIIEYKRKILLPLFTFAESLKYDSRGFEDLVQQAEKLSPLIYVLLLQRLIARGTVPLKKQEIHIDEDRQLGIKEIIQDVNDRIQMDQSTAMHQSIKNILAQVSLYKKELENMKKMLPNIPKEKAEGFSDNFKKTFAEINKRIEENYSSYIREEIQQYHESLHTNPLSYIDVKSMGKLFLEQARTVSKLRSTLTFAESEGFRTRAFLVSIEKEKEELLGPFTREMTEYKKYTESEEGAAALSKAFSSEIVHNLNKAIKRLKKSE